jgi:hypothetical protein
MTGIPWARTRGVRARRVATCRRCRSLRRGRGAIVLMNAERIPDSQSQARRDGHIEAAQGREREAHRSLSAGGRERRIEAWAQGGERHIERERERKESEAQGRERTAGTHGFPGLGSPTTHGPTHPQHLTAGHNVQADHLSEKTRWEGARRRLRHGATTSLPWCGPSHHPSTHTTSTLSGPYSTGLHLSGTLKWQTERWTSLHPSRAPSRCEAFPT